MLYSMQKLLLVLIVFGTTLFAPSQAFAQFPDPEAEEQQLLEYSAVEMQEMPEEDVEDAFVFVEVMPQFPGGEEALMNYMHNHLNVPNQHDINGQVFLSFVVNEDGSITHLEVVKGLGQVYDDAAVAMVQEMPNWVPGTIKGQLIKVKYILKVPFSN